MRTALALCGLVTLVTFVGRPCMAQVIPAERRTDWSTAGFQLDIPEPTATVDITGYGGVGDGVTPNGAALASALAAVAGQMGVIHFPPGNYLFTSTITLPDSVILHGATADSTTLTFSLGGAGYCIAVMGQEDVQQYALNQASARGTSHLWTSSTAGLAPGDEIRLYRNDADLVVSSWALGTTGQIARVTTIEPDGFDLSSPLRASYTLDDAPYFRKLRSARFTGIECLKIIRTDATPADEWSNIWFSRASHCWVKGVESEQCNFAHVEFFASTNCEVGGCYFHHAFGYGGNGQAYGVLAYYTAGENLVYDNIFEHLRHAMIVQAGANGNVFAYNRSVDPFWSQFPLPANSAGEIVLHGDHPYLNLFEGNQVQNIVIDDSHGANGPFNTLFRNRATGWGLFMNNAPPTDSVNFVGNEIGGSPGFYMIQGDGHLEYGNMVQGTITPAGTGDLLEGSYYATAVPGFLLPVGGWPQFGPNSIPPGSIPAALRYDSGNGFALCPSEMGTGSNNELRTGTLRCSPVPFYDRFMIECTSPGLAGEIVLRDAFGRVVRRLRLMDGWQRIEVGCADLPAAAYLVEMWSGAVRKTSLRVIKQ